MQTTLARLWLVVVLVSMAVPVSAQAPLPAPSGPVILEVSGAIAVTNGDGVARFDRAMLDALGTVTVTTKNPWSEGVHTYQGVSGAALLERLGASGTVMEAFALNDYTVKIPVDDFLSLGVILATRRDGKAMRVRDQGPVFVIYPFDDRPNLRSSIYFDRSIWQLKRLVVK